MIVCFGRLHSASDGDVSTDGERITYEAETGASGELQVDKSARALDGLVCDSFQ